MSGRSGSRGEFGGACAVRPGSPADRPRRCLRGHLLKVGGGTRGWNHEYRLFMLTCRVCWDLERVAGPGRDRRLDRATWCVVDVTCQYQRDNAPHFGLALVQIPPELRAATGRIEIRHDGHALGDADLTLCPVDRRAILEHVRVDSEHRRRGYGTVLVAAALALGQGYDWTTTATDNSLEARAFWAATGLPGPFPPAYCSHMRESMGIPWDA